MVPKAFFEERSFRFTEVLKLSTLFKSPEVRQEPDVHAWYMCRPNGLADISLPAWHPTVVDRGTGKSIALRLVGPHVE